MYTKAKIDCHTHIVSKEIAREYFVKTDNIAIVMEMAESIFKNPECVETVLSDKRLVFSPVIDLKMDISEQLERIRPHINDWKIVGLKFFLTYQKGRADEERLFPVYDFAEKYNLTITYHTGLPSLVLPCDNDMDGSKAEYIGKVCDKYPNVNFVAAHLDDPRFMECIDVMSTHPNLFSDFSGAYETGTKEGNDIEGAIECFKKAILSKPGMEKQILYGTDFCPPINLSQIDEYDYTISKIFNEKDFELIYLHNPLKAFPAIKNFINIQSLVR